MNKQLKLLIDDVRRLAIRRQLLDGGGELPEGKEGVNRTIACLGYVQIDTISVVARAHHQTLWARRPDYDPTMLHELLSHDRRIFEYWGHAASYLPIEDYRYYLPRMRRSPTSDRGKLWISKNESVMQHVYERIKAEGPLASKDFAQPEGRKGGEWWDWKPSKMALEMLLTQGKLMVKERRNFQRIYDLTERILPMGVNTQMPDEEESGRFFVERALDAHGVATEAEIRWHIHGMSLEATRRAIAELIEEGSILPVGIAGRDGLTLYSKPGTLEARPQPLNADLCRLLCPFDNLIILRDRTQWLFDFHYTLECYVPAKGRVWGYFVFPILLGDRIIGRLDPKADRKSQTLHVRSLHFEKGAGTITDALEPVAQEIARFAHFNGCRAVEFAMIKPAGHKRSMKSLVRRAMAALSS